jgi:hypothetical protein
MPPTRQKKGRAPTKKRGGAGGGSGSNDSDVDSRGNIRGLIDYDYDSSADHISDSDESFNSDDMSPDERYKGYRRGKRTGPAAAAGRRTGGVPPPPTRRTSYKMHDEDSESDSESELSDSTPAKHGHRYRTRAATAAAAAVRGGKHRHRFTPDSHRSASDMTESEEEEEYEDSDEDYEESDYDSDEDYADPDEDEEDSEQTIVIRLSGGGAGGAEDRVVPQRHNLKKESPEVKKFVELMTKPVDENDIDMQIDQFKALDTPKRAKLIEALEHQPTTAENSMTLMFNILTMKLQKETQAMILAKYKSLQTMDQSTGEYFKLRNWLEKVCAVPFGLYKEMPVRIEQGPEQCGAFMERAKKCLDAAVYSQEESKLQILQFIASKIANPESNGLSLLLIGPPGIGKTSLIKNGIAKALDWPFQFISLGGDSDASTYTGHQLVYESSHAGKIVNSLCAAKSMSMVLLFDELDKISQTPKGEEVQNLLVHLTDQVQNSEFEDKYLSGIPIDLSKVMFVFSANDINKIDKILLDRMLVVKLEGYKAKDKIIIAEQHLLPAALRDVNLEEKVGLSKEMIAYIIEHYATEEDGVRELKRCIEAIVQKINMLRLYNDKTLPFHIKDFSLPFVVKREHVDLFLKKREPRSTVPFGMYI